jgi:hypothetical protein
MWYDNLDAIVASQQDTILGLPEFGNPNGQPNTDRQQGHREGESSYVRQHPLPIIVCLFRDALIARQVIGDFEPVNQWRAIIFALGEG